MREEKELLESLEGATSLIDDAVSGRISVEEFVKRYGNYYYYEALDGHEAEDDQTRALLHKYRELIALHEEAQTNVVDITYVGPKETAEKFIGAGRILPDVAAQRLAQLATKHELMRWLDTLRGNRG